MAMKVLAKVFCKGFPYDVLPCHPGSAQPGRVAGELGDQKIELARHAVARQPDVAQRRINLRNSRLMHTEDGTHSHRKTRALGGCTTLRGKGAWGRLRYSRGQKMKKPASAQRPVRGRSTAVIAVDYSDQTDRAQSF
jgi:hypothetical protein